MGYLYLTLSVILSAATNVIGSLYNRKNDQIPGAGSLFSLLVSITACIGWGILYLVDGTTDFSVILYSAGFGLCYTAAIIGLIFALKYGPLSLTSLLVGLSLVITAIWGLLFWGAPVTAFVIIGLVLVVISTYLCVYNKKADDGKQISVKWLLFALLSVCGNAGCSILQRTQQMAYQNQYGNELMFFALLFSCVICIVLYLKDRKNTGKTAPKRSLYFPILAGVCNLALNLLVILLAGTDISATLIYPTISVGAVVLNLLVSVLGLKEKLTLRQWIGIAVGLAAVLLLSI